MTAEAPLSGRSVWITGAGKGIGRSVALALAREGARVVASARNEDDLNSLVREAEPLSGSVSAYVLDVTDAEACARAFAEIEAEHGALDQVVFNAGTHIPTPASAFKVDDIRALTEVNLMGVANGLAAVMPAMIERRRGRIAAVASIAGYGGLPGAAGYGATKAGVINMCEALRPELAAHGVVLQVINPGFVKTPLTDKNDFPMPFLMPVEAAAERVVAGLRSDRFEIVFPRRFAYMLKALRLIPYGLYFALTKRLVRA
jgi:NAD(P)-dependent dehydrogenase (short-subunit alcohol dehydrogenase family)